MNKEKLFNEFVNYLSGSSKGIKQAFADICQYSEPTIEVPNQEVIDEFEQYLENIEMFCCEECGWWGYPGEGECDCYEECYNCENMLGDCTCDSTCLECEKLLEDCTCED